MIVLDTNVISELMRPAPSLTVAGWLDDQPPQSVWTTSVCAFELQMGVYLMPEGKRRHDLDRRMRRLLDEFLAGRVLAFDVAASRAAAEFAAKQRTAGRTIDVRDIMIAGIVATRKATLATRNTKHFQDAGITLVDPWAEGQ